MYVLLNNSGYTPSCKSLYMIYFCKESSFDVHMGVLLLLMILMLLILFFLAFRSHQVKFTQKLLIGQASSEPQDAASSPRGGGLLTQKVYAPARTAVQNPYTHQYTFRAKIHTLSSTRILKKHTLSSTTGIKHNPLKSFMEIDTISKVQNAGCKIKIGTQR